MEQLRKHNGLILYEALQSGRFTLYQLNHFIHVKWWWQQRGWI
jgi:hypothetical protein